jgi:hypothetical protein
MKHISVNVDGQNLHARHFASFSEEDGVKQLIADGITKDEKWAKKAHAACVKAVKDSEPKQKATKNVNHKPADSEPGNSELA